MRVHTVSKKNLFVISPKSLDSIGDGKGLYERHYSGESPVYVRFQESRLTEKMEFTTCNVVLGCASSRCLTRLEQVFMVDYPGFHRKNIHICYSYFEYLDGWVIMMGYLGFTKQIAKQKDLPMFDTLKMANEGAMAIAKDPFLLINMLEKTSASNRYPVVATRKVDVIQALGCKSFDYSQRFGGETVQSDSEFSPSGSSSDGDDFISDSSEEDALELQSSSEHRVDPPELSSRNIVVPSRKRLRSVSSSKRIKPLTTVSYDAFRHCSQCQNVMTIPFFNEKMKMFCLDCVLLADYAQWTFDFRTSAVLRQERTDVPSFDPDTDFQYLLAFPNSLRQIGIFAKMFKNIQVEVFVKEAGPVVEVFTGDLPLSVTF